MPRRAMAPDRHQSPSPAGASKSLIITSNRQALLTAPLLQVLLLQLIQVRPRRLPDPRDQRLIIPANRQAHRPAPLLQVFLQPGQERH